MLISPAAPEAPHGRSLRRSEREDLVPFLGHADCVDLLKLRMSEPESQSFYKKRAACIERCFGDMLCCRIEGEHRGLTRFSRRSLNGAKTPLGLRTRLHNGMIALNKKSQNENQQNQNRQRGINNEK